MSRKWTVDEAKAYILKVLKGKQQSGLKYCSAVDFLMNHTNVNVNLHPLSEKEDDNDSARVNR